MKTEMSGMCQTPNCALFSAAYKITLQTELDILCVC